MDIQYKFGGIIGLTMLLGTTLGGLISNGLGLVQQEKIYSKYKVKIESTQCDEGMLTTFKTSNGEISYLVDEMAGKSIEETIFYMERLGKKSIVIDDLMALYRIIDGDFNNQIDLDETNFYKSVLRSRYFDESFKRFQNVTEKRR